MTPEELDTRLRILETELLIKKEVHKTKVFYLSIAFGVIGVIVALYMGVTTWRDIPVLIRGKVDDALEDNATKKAICRIKEVDKEAQESLETIRTAFSENSILKLVEYNAHTREIRLKARLTADAFVLRNGFRALEPSTQDASEGATIRIGTTREKCFYYIYANESGIEAAVNGIGLQAYRWTYDPKTARKAKTGKDDIEKDAALPKWISF